MQLGTDDNIKSTLGFIGSTGDKETNYLAAVIIQLLDRINTLELVIKSNVKNSYSNNKSFLKGATIQDVRNVGGVK